MQQYFYVKVYLTNWMTAFFMLQFEMKVDRVWIIDVDAHKGDGAAAFTAGNDSIRTWLKERNIPVVFLMAGGYGDEVWQVYAQFLLWALHLRYEHI